MTIQEGPSRSALFLGKFNRNPSTEGDTPADEWDVTPRPFLSGESRAATGTEPPAFHHRTVRSFTIAQTTMKTQNTTRAAHAQLEAQTAMERRRDDPVHHLDVNPVNEQRAAPEQSQRTPPAAGRRPPFPGVRDRDRRTQQTQPQEKESSASWSRNWSARTERERTTPSRRRAPGTRQPHPARGSYAFLLTAHGPRRAARR